MYTFGYVFGIRYKPMNGKIRCIKVWGELDSKGFIEGNTYDVIKIGRASCRERV